MYRGRTPADVCREPLPDHPDLARFVATLFQRLGGTLEIDENGRRLAHRPERRRLRRDGLPQLPDAKPWERFGSLEEWEGAMKLCEYWLNRLSAPDKEYVFTLLAPLALDPDDRFDFREKL
jgi:hypothetical protein